MKDKKIKPIFINLNFPYLLSKNTNEIRVWLFVKIDSNIKCNNKKIWKKKKTKETIIHLKYYDKWKKYLLQKKF